MMQSFGISSAFAPAGDKVGALCLPSIRILSLTHTPQAFVPSLYPNDGAGEGDGDAVRARPDFCSFLPRSFTSQNQSPRVVACLSPVAFSQDDFDYSASHVMNLTDS